MYVLVHLNNNKHIAYIFIKNIFSKTKKISKKSGFLQISLLSVPVKLESHVCYCIQCIGIDHFGWSMWRKSGLTQSGNWKSISINFSDNCGYFSLIPHQNSTRDSFLTISCNVVSETISVNFSHSIHLEKIRVKKANNTY